MLRLGIILVMVSLLMALVSPACFADNAYMKKLSGGVINVATGWVEIPKQSMDTYNTSKNIAEALTIGFIKGVFFALGRTVAGAVDTLFFFVAPEEGSLVEPMFQLCK